MMKAKCFHCDRLRVPEMKLTVLAHALKFIKAGEIIGSKKIRQYFYAIAKEYTSLKHQNDFDDEKKLAKIMNAINRILGEDHRANKVHVSLMCSRDLKDQLNNLARRHNIEKEKFEHQILGLLDEIEMNENPEETNKIAKSGITSIIQKY